MITADSGLPVAIPAILAAGFLIYSVFWIRFFLRTLWAGPRLLNLRRRNGWWYPVWILVPLALVFISHPHKSTWLVAIQRLTFSWLVIQSVVGGRLELRERGVFWSIPSKTPRFVRLMRFDQCEWQPGPNF